MSSERLEHATGQLSAKLHLKDQLLTSLSGDTRNVNAHTIARGCWLRMRKCRHRWGESGRETITGIERVQETIRGNINAFSSGYCDSHVHRFWRRN